MNVPHWNIENYGTVSRRNVAWNTLVSLLVRRSGKPTEVKPDDMLVGEEAIARFGLGSTAGMTTKKKKQHQECKVVRVEDQEDTSV